MNPTTELLKLLLKFDKSNEDMANLVHNITLLVKNNLLVGCKEILEKNPLLWTTEEKFIVLNIYRVCLHMRKSFENLQKMLEVKLIRDKIAELIKNNDEDIAEFLEDNLIEVNYTEEEVESYTVRAMTRKTLRVNSTDKTFERVGSILSSLVGGIFPSS